MRLILNFEHSGTGSRVLNLNLELSSQYEKIKLRVAGQDELYTSDKVCHLYFYATIIILYNFVVLCASSYLFYNVDLSEN